MAVGYLSPTKAKTRKKILQKSRRLFERQGIAQTTIKDIIKSAEITRPTFYAYFPEKRELILAVLYQCFSELYDFPEPPQVDSPLENLKNLLHTVLDRYLDCPKIMKLIVEYYQIFSTPQVAEEAGFAQLAGIRQFYDVMNRNIDALVLEQPELSRDDVQKRFFTIFNFNIALGMRYSLRSAPFIGYQIRIDRESLHEGLVELTDLLP